MIARIRAFGIWKVTIASVIGAGLLVFLTMNAAGGGASQPVLAADERLVTVERGDFVKRVDISGRIVFPASASLSFSIDGTVDEVLVREGRAVEAGQVLASLDEDAAIRLQRDVAQAQRELRAAEAALRDAREKYEDAAEDYRVVFRKWLGIELSSEQMTQAPSALRDTWGVDLDALFGSRAGFHAGIPADDPSTAWSEPVVHAWRLAPMPVQGTCGSTLPSDNGEGLDAVCVQREMEDAWEALNGDDIGIVEISALEAELGLAKTGLRQAQERLQEAVLIAPFDSIVTSVTITTGDSVERGQAVIKLIDAGVVELEGTVDQMDVSFVGEASPALVTLDAFRGQVHQGIVTAVGAIPNESGGYPVSVELAAPEGAVFREGMTGTARVVLLEELDVLLAPVNAIRGTADRPVVHVLEQGARVERVVVLGESDESWQVIEHGLQEGDQVIVARQAASALTPSSFGGPRMSSSPN